MKRLQMSFTTPTFANRCSGSRRAHLRIALPGPTWYRRLLMRAVAFRWVWSLGEANAPLPTNALRKKHTGSCFHISLLRYSLHSDTHYESNHSDTHSSTPTKLAFAQSTIVAGTADDRAVLVGFSR